MIKLSNGHKLEYVVASGALAYDGRGWFWEWPLVWLGLIKSELFVIVTKSLTLKKRPGNLRWWKFWTCFRIIFGGSFYESGSSDKIGFVNKIGLTNPGFDWFIEKVLKKINLKLYRIIVSLYGSKEELVEMAKRLNDFDIVAIEINDSCPNSGKSFIQTESVIESNKAVKAVSRHPIITKVSVAQDYLAIAKGLVGVAEAISINSVLWEIAFPGKRSPLWRLEKKVGGGGGGVSGYPAQIKNWAAVWQLGQQGLIPVIGPSIMRCADMAHLKAIGAQAFSFGAIHILTPWKPTQIVKKEMKLGQKKL